MKTPPPYEIVHLDPAILAISKAPGIAVIPGRGRVRSVLDQLATDARLGGAAPLPVHRIDADTSGILLLALTPQAQKHLSGQFRQRTVVKEYWALVRGTPLQESGSVDLPIGVDPHDRRRMAVRGLEARKCRTKWVVAERFRGVTFLKVYPVTGRRHQIRVHLKAMGYPLAVDPYYGGATLLLSEFKRRYKLGKHAEERPIIDRLTLHARSLVFRHPLDEREITLIAEPPKDFSFSLTSLRKWAK